MAFPTIVGTATWQAGTSTTAHSAVMPAGIQAGDLIVVVWMRGSLNNAGTLDGKWTNSGMSGIGLPGVMTGRMAYAIADGSESSATLAFTTVSGGARGCSVTIVFRNWGRLPEVNSVCTQVTAASTVDVPSLTPSWGSADNTWVVCAIENGAGITKSSVPTNYADAVDSTDQNNIVSIARRNLTASSEDPNTFGYSGSTAADGFMFAVSGPVAVTSSGDSGSGSDASGSKTMTGSADTGSGSDVRSAYTASMTRTDAGTGAENIGNRSFATSDAGTGVDTSAVHAVAFITVTRPGPADLAAVLRAHHTPVARLLFLEADLDTIIHEIDAERDGVNRWLLSGNVTEDRTRNIMRSASAAIVNTLGLYTPVDSGSLVWPNRIVRLERGAMVGDTPQYKPLITGLLDTWKIDASSGVVSFNVWSRMHLADQKFSGPVSFAAGTPVETVIRSIAELAGMGTSDDFYALDSGGLSLPDVRTYDTKDTMLDAMVKLAFDNGLDLFDDGAGVLTMAPFVDPTAADVAWDFAPGSGSTLLDMNRSGQATSVYNRAIALGIGTDGYPIRAEARVTNPDDPLYNPVDGTGPLGDRPRTYTTYDVTGQQALNDLAYRLLVEGALYQEAVGASSIPIPLVEARDVVRFTGAGVDDTYLLDQVSIPIGPGNMSLSARKVRSLLA